MTAEIFHTTKVAEIQSCGDRGSLTVKVEVLNTSGEHLGLIGWYSPWRQYTFTPTSEAELTFNDGCIQGIADVLGMLRHDRLASGRQRI